MNLLSTIMKQREQIYYTKYFENNWNNIKNTWNRIKSIIKIHVKHFHKYCALLDICR